MATTKLHRGWWGTDLGKYRACDGTYAFIVDAKTALPSKPPASAPRRRAIGADGTNRRMPQNYEPARAKPSTNSRPR